MPPMYYDGIEAKFVYYNGKETTGYYNGVKIWPAEAPIYSLTLQNDGHGTVTANALTGHKGDTVTLSPTYNTYYRFNNYGVTGGTINGNTFTFGDSDATAKANFKVNSFTAKGIFRGQQLRSYGRTCTFNWYPSVTASSTNVPSNWKTTQTNISKNTQTYGSVYTTSAKYSDIWTPSNVSGYLWSGYAVTTGYNKEYATNNSTTNTYSLLYSNTKFGSSTGKLSASSGTVAIKVQGSTTNLSQIHASGYFYSSKQFDTYTLAYTTGAGAWSASGIAP